LKGHIAAGSDVVLVLHSYGGSIGSCALEGLPISGPGTKGGVLAVIYLTALTFPQGTSTIDVFGGDLSSWALSEVHLHPSAKWIEGTDERTVSSRDP
jgi:hypothetical protein